MNDNGYRLAGGRDVALWAPRIMGLGLAGFLALFALDSLTNPQDILETTIALVMGLVPSLVVLTVVGIGWRHPGLAAVLFTLFALIYSLDALSHPGWVLLIAGPLLLVAVLFFVSWRARSRKTTDLQ